MAAQCERNVNKGGESESCGVNPDFHVLSEIYVALICHSDRLIWQVTVHQNMNGRVSAVLTARLKLLVPNG